MILNLLKLAIIFYSVIELGNLYLNKINNIIKTKLI